MEEMDYESLPEDHMMRKAYEQLFDVAVHGSGTITWSENRND